MEVKPGRSGVAHACPDCGRSWALRGTQVAAGAWAFWCRYCPWRDTRGRHIGPASPWVHGVHLYPHDDALIESLEVHVGAGLSVGGAGIVIATPEHRAALRRRLDVAGVAGSLGEGRFIELDAASTLRLFMRDGSPDRELFAGTVGSLVREVATERPLHAFGEMVDVLWADGNVVAALELEAMWSELQQEVDFALLCAYAADHIDADGRAAITRVHDHSTGHHSHS